MVNTEEAKKMASGIDIKGTIRDKEEIKTVNTRNGKSKVCGAYLEDDIGRIKITLWGDDTERVKDGDVVEFGGAYTTEFRGEKQLQKGRNSGKLEVIQDSDKTEPEAEPCEYCGSKGICAESCRCDKCKRTRYLGTSDAEVEEILKQDNKNKQDHVTWWGH